MRASCWKLWENDALLTAYFNTNNLERFYQFDKCAVGTILVLSIDRLYQVIRPYFLNDGMFLLELVRPLEKTSVFVKQFISDAIGIETDRGL